MNRLLEYLVTIVKPTYIASNAATLSSVQVSRALHGKMIERLVC